MKKDTIIRTIVLFFALTNCFLTLNGHSVLPFEESEVAEYAGIIFAAASAVVAWWKNNSFSPEAIEADKYLEELRERE